MSTVSDPTQNPNATEARLEQLAKEYSALDAEKEPIEQRMEQIKSEYRALLEVGATVKAAGRTVSIQRNARFDPDKFRAAFPVLQFPHLWTTIEVPNTEAIKESVPPAAMRNFQKEGTPKVVIR